MKVKNTTFGYGVFGSRTPSPMNCLALRNKKGTLGRVPFVFLELKSKKLEVESVANATDCFDCFSVSIELLSDGTDMNVDCSFCDRSRSIDSLDE